MLNSIVAILLIMSHIETRFVEDQRLLGTTLGAWDYCVEDYNESKPSYCAYYRQLNETLESFKVCPIDLSNNDLEEINNNEKFNWHFEYSIECQ